jgi:hypothetical protein
VPISALITIESIPEEFKAKHEEITVHGLLASFLAFKDDPKTLARYQPWRDVWPTLEDFKETMPLLWSVNIGDGWYGDEPGLSINHMSHQGLVPLPPAIAGIWGDTYIRSSQMSRIGLPSVRASGFLGKQKEKLKKDFEVVQSAFPGADLDIYVYHWLIVNTRTFYFVPPGISTPSNPNDCMALCPFADYFNHSDAGVRLL